MSGQRYIGWCRKRGGNHNPGWFKVADGACLARVEKDTAAARQAQPFVLAETCVLPEGLHPDDALKQRSPRTARKEK
jgi:hypothetical protein